MGIKERKEREKIQRQQDIIEAAVKLFFTKGIQETTMEDIAEEVELSKGTLYLYFKSKEEIKYEVALRGINLLKSVMEKAIDISLNAMENLVRVGWAFIDFSRENTAYFNLFILFQSSDLHKMNIPKMSIDQYLREESPFTILINLVKDGVKDGSLRPNLRIGETAATLWSQMLGLLIVQQNKKEFYEIFEVKEESILATNFDLLLYGIAGDKKNNL